MKLPKLLTASALVAVLGLPLVATAQQPPPPPGAPSQSGHRHGMGILRFKNLNLTQQQQTQIESLMKQFHDSHPAGSPPDRQAREQLHQQIDAILTPTQRATLKADREQMHDKRGEGPGGNPPPAPLPSQEP